MAADLPPKFTQAGKPRLHAAQNPDPPAYRLAVGRPESEPRRGLELECLDVSYLETGLPEQKFQAFPGKQAFMGVVHIPPVSGQWRRGVGDGAEQLAAGFERLPDGVQQVRLIRARHMLQHIHQEHQIATVRTGAELREGVVNFANIQATACGKSDLCGITVNSRQPGVAEGPQPFERVASPTAHIQHRAVASLGQMGGKVALKIPPQVCVVLRCVRMQARVMTGVVPIHRGSKNAGRGGRKLDSCPRATPCQRSGASHTARMPTVSVVTVFHRDTPFLRPAIASILGQTFRDLELVLVDNGTGLAPEALGSLGEDSRVRWVRLPRNEGIPAGHNAGIAAATGEFIALLDYDDLAVPTRLEKQVAALRADPALGLVSALAEIMDEAGRTTGRMFCIPDPAGHRAYAQYAAPVITPVAMARRVVFEQTPYRPQFPFAADLDFQSRITEHWRMAVLPEVLLRYRWYGTQTTQQKQASIDNSRCAISLVTARRRAGRPEGAEEIVALAEGLTPAEYSRCIADLSLAEGFWELAAYRTRRALALDKSPSSAMRSFRQGWQIWRQTPAAERNRVVRMFFTGPVRALDLRPA